MTNFLDLPPELRIQIYQHVLIRNQPTIIGEAYRWSLVKHSIGRQLAQPSITRASRLIRNESLPIFYGENMFIAREIFWSRRKTVQKWLSAIGLWNRALLKNCLVHYYPYERAAAAEVEAALKVEAELGCEVEIVRDDRVPRLHGQYEVWRLRFNDQAEAEVAEGLAALGL